MTMTSRRLWVPALAGLLVAVLLGPAGATAVEPRTVTASIMIPAAAFMPTRDDSGYFNAGSYLTGGADGTFLAPLSFPVPVVNIKRITLYAWDNGLGSVCAQLHRSRPAAGTKDYAGFVCTVDSTTDPQTVYTTAINPSQVNTAFHGPYLAVTFFGPVKLYGVKVNYSYTP